MNAQLPWLAVVAATTLINGLALGYLGWREQHRALRTWAWAWFTWAVAIVPLSFFEQQRPPALAAMACGLLWVISTLCFLLGTHQLSDRRLPRAWGLVAGAAVAVSIALALGHSSELGMVPLVLFQSVGMIATGGLILRRRGTTAGAWLCGVALIGLGLHILDAPIAAQHPEWMVWGFVLATALEVMTALGMLMLYYEQARVEVLRAQHALSESARTEALGRIAGGVAHDFNNMLAVMQGHLDLMRHRESEVDDDSLEAIEHAVQQATRLTSQLLAFGRRAVIQPRSVDVREVVDRTVQLLRKVVPENIRLSFIVHPGDYAASLDQSLLEQIVLNLVTNARDAISSSGRIDVELSRKDAPQPSLLLRVRDDGVGMDQAVTRRIFEPFFTTKDSKRGTGLGLASVQGAVSQLGGTIRVESSLGRGALFEVMLPWVRAKDEAAPTASGPRSRGCRILLVDDDDGVRKVTSRMLQTGGHRVEQAADGRQALQKVREQSYDLIITDVVMPELGGLDLRAEIARLRPETPVLLTSGYPRHDKLHDLQDHFLSKPFNRQALLSAVTRLTNTARHTDHADTTA